MKRSALPAPALDIPLSGLDATRRLRLLEMTAIRVTIASLYSLLVGLAMLGLAFTQDYPWYPMAYWTLALLALNLVFRQQLARFQDRLVSLDGETEQARQACYAQWYPRVQRQAALLGGLLGTLTWVNQDVPSYDFKLLLAVVIAIMMATNAAHQTPVLRIYYTYYGLAWGGTLLTMPIVFPDHYVAMLILGLIHAGSIALDARRVHRFFVRQVGLEQHSAVLAEKARLAEAEAVLALQQKNEFLATASHDLRQPLHALNLTVEALAFSTRDPAQHALIGEVQACARSLTLMFNSILDLSKLETGQSSLRLRPLDIGPLLQEISRPYAKEARQRHLDFRLRLPQGPVLIETDEALLRQIISNLLQNALRYTPAGSVLLALRRLPTPRIEVVDTGIGIAESDQPRIHEPFYRARVGFSDSIDSHGLGLAVVSRCARLLNVQHGFHSRPGRGSRFWVAFPASIGGSPADGVQPPASIGTALPDLRGDRVLIVEDDPMVVRSWIHFLTVLGLRIEIAADLGRALHLLDSGFEPNYLLCDLRLRSGDNGYSVLQQVLNRHPDISCALVSGEFNAPELQEAESEGVTVLRKPVSGEELQRLFELWRDMRYAAQDADGVPATRPA